MPRIFVVARNLSRVSRTKVLRRSNNTKSTTTPPPGGNRADTARKDTPGIPPSPSSNDTAVGLKSFATGSLAGLLGSLAGMGGGFVMIPIMTSNLLKLSQHQAHGTSLFAVAATGLAGAISYGDDTVRYPEAAAISLTAMVTARMGAQATLNMSGKFLKRSLGILMLCMAPAVPAKAYYLSLSDTENTTSSETTTSVGTQQDGWNRLVVPALIGIGSGYLAGVFGVGGGTIVVPALAMFSDLTHHEALGTSLAAMTLPAVIGTYSHYSSGNCNLRVAPFLALGALSGAYGGAQVSLHTDETALRWGFSGLLGILGVRTLLKA